MEYFELMAICRYKTVTNQKLHHTKIWTAIEKNSKNKTNEPTAKWKLFTIKLLVVKIYVRYFVCIALHRPGLYLDGWNHLFRI